MLASMSVKQVLRVTLFKQKQESQFRSRVDKSKVRNTFYWESFDNYKIWLATGRFSRCVKARGSCTGLVTVGPAKV